MRKHANFVRLIWAVLLLLLVQAWAAVTHVHAVPGTRLEAVVANTSAGAIPDTAATPDTSDTDRVPADGTTECDCLWCSPRLHLFISAAIAVQLLCVILRLLSRVRQVDVAAPTWRTRFLSPPALRAPPALARAAG